MQLHIQLSIWSLLECLLLWTIRIDLQQYLCNLNTKDELRGKKSLARANKDNVVPGSCVYDIMRMFQSASSLLAHEILMSTRR